MKRKHRHVARVDAHSCIFRSIEVETAVCMYSRRPPLSSHSPPRACSRFGSCTQPSAPSQAATKPPPAPDHDPVGAIRAAGMGMDSAVQVQPLRDPAIEGFLKQAHAAETAKNYDAAAAATSSALKLVPDAPDILQYQAEVEGPARQLEGGRGIGDQELHAGSEGRQPVRTQLADGRRSAHRVQGCGDRRRRRNST